MPAYMKEAVADPKHPDNKVFMELVNKGCPRCDERLYQKGNFPIGVLYCSDTHKCPYEFEFDTNIKNWKIGPDGKAGIRNERFLPFWQTEEGKREFEERKKKKLR